jgi:kumamolisin
MKKKILNRLLVLSISSLLVLMAIAPVAQTMSVPYPEPVYQPCFVAGAPSHLLVLFNLNDQAGLTNYLDNAYYNPLSPSYHHFLTASQFDALYSAPAWVFGVVDSIFASNGLSIIASAPMLIEGAGTDVQVGNALAQLSASASIQRYIIGAECMPQTYNISAGKTAPSYTPTDVRGPYIGPISPSTVQSEAVATSCTPTEAITGGLLWLPCGLQTIYDENPLLSQNVQGSHQTIALVDAYGDPETTQANNLVYDNIACSDFSTFNSDFNLPNSGCSVIYPTGVPQLSTGNYQDAEGWATETMIDMEYSHVMAPQAHIMEVTASTDYDDLYASIEYVVNNHMANTISLSWGEWEDLFYYAPSSAALLVGYDEIFQQAAAQGISVFASSGDYGAYDPILGQVAASAPATDPWVTGVGGTTLNATFTSSLVWRHETAWSLGTDSYNPTIASGGGFSMLFGETIGQRMIHISTQVTSIPLPVLGITFYPQGQRGVPDLAADGDPSTGVMVVQDGTFSPYIWGGTSLSSPLTAGMTTTVQSSNRLFTIGTLAPTLYQLYSVQPRFYVHQSLFSISQLVHGVGGTMFVTAGGQNGPFNVTPGVWNPVAGLGQLNVYGISQIV